MNEYIVTAEVKIVLLGVDEIDVKEEFEQSIGWLVDNYRIVSCNQVVED